MSQTTILRIAIFLTAFYAQLMPHTAWSEEEYGGAGTELFNEYYGIFLPHTNVPRRLRERIMDDAVRGLCFDAQLNFELCVQAYGRGSVMCDHAFWLMRTRCPWLDFQ